MSADAGAWDLQARVRRGSTALTYLAISLPLGAVGLAAVLAVALGAALSALWVGAPLLLAAVVLCRWLAELDRRVVNWLLDAHLPPMRLARRRTTGNPVRMTLATLSDRQLWRVIGGLAVKLPISLLMLIIGVAPLLLTAWLLVVGVRGIGGLGDETFLGPWTLDPLIGVVLLALSVPSAILSIAALDATRIILRTLARALLAPRTVPGGPVREMLAESLGDRSLTIAYWLADRNAFVDEAGHPVELPEPGTGRAWTAVERHGRPVAAIVHDAALDTGPELVQAAAAAAALAIDNERLKADLRARVEELRVSRVRIVEAADAARRRLERDLHDGAQQQLVSLALDLRLLRNRVGDTDALPLVDGLAEKLGAALADLRELARGIHPAILTDRGLAPAIASLADRATLPVRSAVSVEGRLPAPIEAAAYFVVAEALTNVTRYASATSVDVTIDVVDGAVAVVVDDDGIGGADMAAGTGLRGLVDRLAALDGELTIESPPGDGTCLTARIPLTEGRPA